MLMNGLKNKVVLISILLVLVSGSFSLVSFSVISHNSNNDTLSRIDVLLGQGWGLNKKTVTALRLPPKSLFQTGMFLQDKSDHLEVFRNFVFTIPVTNLFLSGHTYLNNLSLRC